MNKILDFFGCDHLTITEMLLALIGGVGALALFMIYVLCIY